jgi:hypothetical protein
MSTIKALTGEFTTEYSATPTAAQWFDAWSQKDGQGRSYFLRLGGMTFIWSSPGAFIR